MGSGSEMRSGSSLSVEPGRTTLGAAVAGVFDGGFALVLHEVFEVIDLRADEAFFKVRVDHARGLRRGGAHGMGQARISSGPTVKKLCKPRRR